MALCTYSEELKGKKTKTALWNKYPGGKTFLFPENTSSSKNSYEISMNLSIKNKAVIDLKLFNRMFKLELMLSIHMFTTFHS